MIWFRRLHKWIGLAIGIQVGIWMLSGLMMGLLDHEHVQGHHYRAVANVAPVSSSSRNVLDVGDILERAALAAPIFDISLRSHLGRTAYQVKTAGGSQLFDATSGRRIVVTAEDAAALAEEDYSGPGQIVSIEPVQAPSMEIRRHSGDAWRVAFDDDEATTLYVAADDGRILERRNDTWRLFDVFWMLHIMDYKEREDFNNALVILVSLIAAWFSITGVVLFFDSFRREDFLALVPGGWWRSPAQIAVCAPHGEVVARVSSHVGGRLYDELARDDIVLPSNCGGGGTCGLCVVNLGPDWPESAADRRLLSESQRKKGIRLSCQAEVASDMVVGISDDVLSAQELTAEVAECRFLTPFIRELRLRLPVNDFDYAAGCYVHVKIPPYKLDYAKLELTPEASRACEAVGAPAISVNKSESRRAYSLATPCEQEPGTIVLNVRLMVPPEGSRALPVGVGSTYMWSVQPGEKLDIVGPLGDFRARDSDADMIFIGGGAGMAPLRAIIRSELLYRKSGRRINFWYGARARADLFYAREFEELQEEFANFHWRPVLSEPLATDSWQGPTGFVHAIALQDLTSANRDLAACEFYICGPPPMLSATRRALVENDIPEASVFFDDFGI